MKKRKNRNKIDCVPIQNPVAKFAHQFNKAMSLRIKINTGAMQNTGSRRLLQLLCRVIGEASRILGLLLQVRKMIQTNTSLISNDMPGFQYYPESVYRIYRPESRRALQNRNADSDDPQ